MFRKQVQKLVAMATLDLPNREAMGREFRNWGVIGGNWLTNQSGFEEITNMKAHIGTLHGGAALAGVLVGIIGLISSVLCVACVMWLATVVAL
jgi:hypothetical protein